MKTIFKTKEGEQICTTSDRMGACDRAMNLAAKYGFDTLIAIDPNGIVFDYTDQLRRDYLPKFSHLKQAA